VHHDVPCADSVPPRAECPGKAATHTLVALAHGAVGRSEGCTGCVMCSMAEAASRLSPWASSPSPCRPPRSPVGIDSGNLDLRGPDPPAAAFGTLPHWLDIL